MNDHIHIEDTTCIECSVQNFILVLCEYKETNRYNGNAIWNREYKNTKCNLCGFFRCEGCNLYGKAVECDDPFNVACATLTTDARLCSKCLQLRKKELRDAERD